MLIKTPLCATLLLAGFLCSAQDGLLRSTPEEQGVSSQGLIQFLDSVGNHHNEFHNIMLLRHGKVVAEGSWAPYRPDLLQTLYSVSKSFTSTAVGFAVSEGKLRVSDKVVSFFPDLLPDSISPYLAALTVKNLLTMTEGQDPDPSGLSGSPDTNWVHAFLRVPILHQPGTQFLYNSLGVYVLSAIVQKATGQKVIDYLTPRLFQPLGIMGADWEESPTGVNTGGWGLRLTIASMAKVGQLYLQHGNWNGRQVLPAAWVAEATTSKIDQGPSWAAHTPKDSSDWLQGYGYLFWRCRHDCYRADGAFGQYIIVMPREDAVLAVTSETSDMQDELNLVWRYLLPALHPRPLPADAQGDTALRQKLASLALAPPSEGAAGDTTAHSFVIKPNADDIREMDFAWAGNQCHLTFTVGSNAYTLSLGRGSWVRGETRMKGPDLAGGARNSLNGLPPFQVEGAYSWFDPHSLKLVLRYIESPHTLTIDCHFGPEGMAARVHNSFEPTHSDIFLVGTPLSHN